MGARTGQEYLESIKSRGPEVWLGAERVQDVTAHPAIGPAARELAHLYDLQHDPRSHDFMLFPSPKTGQPVGTQFLVPRSLDDLTKRRRMHHLWAEATFGLMGRTTDFLGSMLTGWYISADFFGPYSDNVRRYFEEVREKDLFLTHTLIDPPIDRSKPPSQWSDPFLNLGVVEETKEGLMVRGAKAVATAAPYAEELLVWPFVPQGYTAQEKRYAIAFALPTHTRGLRFICREPYGGGSRLDHPLASRFDEMDATAVFDNVLVPWERVFVNQDLERVDGLNKGYVAGPLAFTGFQTAIRLLVKLQLTAGLAKKAMEMVKREPPFIQDLMGEVLSYIECVRACILCAESTAAPDKEGVYIPNARFLVVPRVMGPWWYPKARELLQLALSTGLIYLPASAKAFACAIGEDIRRYFQGAEAPAEERLKVFRAAADLALSSVGGRHELYERFYSGDPFFLRSAWQYKRYDWSEPLRLVDSLLSSTTPQDPPEKGHTPDP